MDYVLSRIEKALEEWKAQQRGAYRHQPHRLRRGSVNPASPLGTGKVRREKGEST